ncbi:hypothetical protein C8R43DRAFT_1136140 [Mycena crocata]|nr:hypothetical protein C8R43DRAFT_1136140 [Mycena crocata]
MNEFYPRQDAQEALTKVITSSIADMAASKTPGNQHLNTLEVDCLGVQPTGRKVIIWRLGPLEGEGNIAEEFTFRMQGVLEKAKLVGTESMGRLDASRIANSSQQVTLTGLGCVLFEDSVQKILELHDLFGRYFQGDDLVNWAPYSRGEDPILSASNRFLTSADENPDAVSIAFNPGVDPVGALSKHLNQGGRFLHTEDNVVSYFRRVETKDPGKIKHEVVVPSTFRLGDLVEIEASVIVFKSKQKSMKMHCNLRVLTLLDSQFTKAAAKAKAEATKRGSGGTVSLRLISFGDGSDPTELMSFRGNVIKRQAQIL